MLVVDHVRRSFGSIAAVNDVSFRVEPGSVFGLLGPNGAGKTTTMRMILGIYMPDGGSIRWKDKPIDLRVRRTFGYLPEERGLYGKMTVRDQIAYFGRLHGLEPEVARERTERWMETLGIAQYAKRACNELSKGNQQKVQLASAVLHEPELLVLDEPFSGLDPVNAQAMLDCIHTLAEGGTALILSSHQMFQIEDACRAFCIVGDGRVRASGTLAELRATFPTRVVRVAPDTPAIRQIFTTRGAQEIRSSSPGSASFELPATIDFAQLLRDAVAAGPVESFERQEPSLGQIYARALGSAL
jgi:ABC-2 type transport system ATP-binding protein